MSHARITTAHARKWRGLTFSQDKMNEWLKLFQHSEQPLIQCFQSPHFSLKMTLPEGKHLEYCIIFLTSKAFQQGTTHAYCFLINIFLLGPPFSFKIDAPQRGVIKNVSDIFYYLPLFKSFPTRCYRCISIEFNFFYTRPQTVNWRSPLGGRKKNCSTFWEVYPILSSHRISKLPRTTFKKTLSSKVHLQGPAPWLYTECT